MNRKTTAWTGIGLVASVAAVAGVVAGPGRDAASAGAAHEQPTTVSVESRRLSTSVSRTGTLTYRARRDGAPYVVFNQLRGIYTELPEVGDRAGCGDVVFRVNDRPVLLLCGPIPAYRDLRVGARGSDVRQLNASLRTLGFAARARVTLRSGETVFTWRTAAALQALQRARGLSPTGTLNRSNVVVLPGPARIARVVGQGGGPARAGMPVLRATSTSLEVQVALAPSQQSAVKPGARVRITLPGNRTANGRVDRLGRVATTPDGQDDIPAAATVPAFVRFDDPRQARGFDAAPVRVEITTGGVRRALSVPATALVGKSGGGYAVEVVRAGGRREQVRVELGVFDGASGLIEISGSVRAGDDVVVPAS